MLDERQRKAAEKIIVALDCPEDEAYEIASELKGYASWLKVGMTLFYAAGPRVIERLKREGFKIFLDLKLHDIPHQVQGATRSLAGLGVDLLTCHASGGAEMMKAAAEGLSSCDAATQLLAITVLTSSKQETLKSCGVGHDLREQVRLLAELSKGMTDGIVCSAQEAAEMRELLGPEALIVTPGVRLAGADCQDQSRVMTPGQALCEGASLLVVGRPITQAEDKRKAFIEFVEDIESSWR